MIGVVRQYRGGLFGGQRVAGFRREVEQVGRVERDAAQAYAHQRRGRLACGGRLGQMRLHMRQDIGGTEVGRAIEQVVPVTASALGIASLAGRQPGVEMRGPFSGGQAVALRGLVQPVQRLARAVRAQQQRAVLVREQTLRGPAMHRRQRGSRQGGHGLIERRQRRRHVPRIGMQLRAQRGMVDHLGLALPQLIGDVERFVKAPRAGQRDRVLVAHILHRRLLRRKNRQVRDYAPST